MIKYKIFLNTLQDFAFLRYPSLYHYIDDEGYVYASHENSVTSQLFTWERHERPKFVNVEFCERVAFYDFDGEPLTSNAVVDVTENDIISVPENAYYMRVCTNKSIPEFYEKTKVYIVEEATPIYGDNITLEYEKNPDSQYFRKKINGDFTFCRDDYDSIMSKPFDFTHHVFISKYEVETNKYGAYARGKFARTDCTINEVEKTLKTSFDNDDEYVDITSGLDNEYDLVKLDVAKNNVMLYRRPMLQIYAVGESIINCFYDRTMFETDFAATTNISELNRWHFSMNMFAMDFEVSEAHILPALFNGKYTGTLTQESGVQWKGEFFNQANSKLVFVAKFDTNGDIYYTIDLQYYDEDLGRYVSQYVADVVKVQNGIQNVQLRNYYQTSEKCKLVFNFYAIAARFVCDILEYRGNETYAIESDDPVANNRNYQRCIGSSISDIYVSNEFSDEPNDNGIAPNGKYYMPPDIRGTYYPIGRTYWVSESLWFQPSVYTQTFDKEARSTFLQKDFYTIGGAIKALLREIAPTIKHEETAEYSQFLYANDPISGRKIDLLITPKSNVIAGEYKEPAMKGLIHLNDIFTMLKNVYQVYWFIDGDKLKLEHISYFENGKSYQGNPQIGIDLTQLKAKNRMWWSFGADEYTFAKSDMPERYEFSWMDDVTAEFKGNAIEIISNYTNKGKKEDVAIPNFTSDIDFILLNPNVISNDGFVVVDAVEANGIIEPDTPYSTGSRGNTYLVPTKAISKAFQGVSAQLTYEIYFSDTTSGNKFFNIVYYRNGEVISESPTLFTTGGGMITSNVSIPIDCDAIGFRSLSGQANAKTYSLRSPHIKASQFVEMTIGGQDYEMQNGYLSMMYLQPRYWVYSMPAKNLRINGITTEAVTTMRCKGSTITFPYTEDPEVNKLIKTNIGNGQIDKMSINIASRAIQVQLKYETE